jgi:hypothetical protein
MRHALQLTAALALFLALPAFAGSGDKPFPEQDLPPSLKPWVKWAMDPTPEKNCLQLRSQMICAWPGKLGLALGGSGGSFRQQLFIEKDSFFPLPGDEKRWPQSVTLDGKAIPVVSRNDAPSLWVPAGAHALAGQFLWNKLPDSLPVPQATAMLELSVNGRAVAFPRRDAAGLLLLREAGDEAAAGGDSARMKIFRKLSDGIPPWLETRIEFTVSGKARELRVPGLLPAGAATVAVSGDLPARVDEGSLRLQVRAGTFSVTVLCRLEAGKEPKALALIAPKPDPKFTAAGWPAQEIWSFEKNETLRESEVSGGTAVDAARAEAPEEWRNLPAFSLNSGDTFSLAEKRRGEPDPAPDQLGLSRQFWLDEDGGGFTVRDAITGTLRKTTRLSLAEGELGRVSVNGEPQLITAAGDKSGVELRKTALSLEADSRLGADSRVPAVGWDSDMNGGVSAMLHLPPGWRLIAANGVDKVPGGWFSQWTLWSFFFVLIVTLTVGKMGGWRWGLTAFFTLALCHGEWGAPQLVWLALLVFALLLRVAPEGKWRTLLKLGWAMTAVKLVLIVAPFFLWQIRTGIYPQVGNQANDLSLGAKSAGLLDSLGRMDRPERRYQYNNALNAPPPPSPAAAALAPVGAPADATEAPMEEPEVKQQEGDEANLNGNWVGTEDNARLKSRAVPKKMTKGEAGKAKSSVDLSTAINQFAQQRDLKGSFDFSPGAVSNSGIGGGKPNQAMQQDPHAVIQTGAGTVTWQWASYSLQWSGPVTKDQKIRFWLISPSGNLFLNFLRVILVTLLAGRLGWLAWRKLPASPAAPAASAPVPCAAMALLVALCLFAAPRSARAGEEPNAPSADTLRQLREKLTRLEKPPACAPDCISPAKVALTLTGNELRISAEIHAGGKGSWPIPGPATSWVPLSVTVDGKPATALSRLADGFLHVRLDPGVHHVEASGPIPPRDGLALEFGEAPRRATASAPGWQVDGIHEDGTADDSVQFSRTLATARGGAVAEGSYPPWLEVTRVLNFGVEWTSETIVRRISPTGSPVVVKIPKLKGMIVTDENRTEKDGEILVTLGRDETEARFMASIKPVDEPLLLMAASGRPWSEIWVVNCGPVWQCDAKGLPVTAHEAGGEFVKTFRPWPGEQLTLTLAKPKGVEGRTVTIDSAVLNLNPGLRLQNVTLSLGVRASRAETLHLTIPENAEIESLTVAGVVKPAQHDHGKLAVAVEPGNPQVVLKWRQTPGISWKYRSPAVDLGMPAVNTEIRVQLPEERWLLLTGGTKWFVFGGPKWGPAILFWGILIFALLAGAALGSLPLSPLSRGQWMLLALGLTQLPVACAIIVAAWFLAMKWRGRGGQERPLTHDLMQIFLVLWTLLALGFLFFAVKQGLTVQPDMQVTGSQSYGASLHWQRDRIAGVMPAVRAVSSPLWVYRWLIMLPWALWLAARMVRWMPWAWQSFTTGGGWKPLWKKKEKPAVPPPLPPAATAPVT